MKNIALCNTLTLLGFILNICAICISWMHLTGIILTLSTVYCLMDVAILMTLAVITSKKRIGLPKSLIVASNYTSALMAIGGAIVIATLLSNHRSYQMAGTERRIIQFGLCASILVTPWLLTLWTSCLLYRMAQRQKEMVCWSRNKPSGPSHPYGIGMIWKA